MPDTAYPLTIHSRPHARGAGNDDDSRVPSAACGDGGADGFDFGVDVGVVSAADDGDAGDGDAGDVVVARDDARELAGGGGGLLEPAPPVSEPAHPLPPAASAFLDSHGSSIMLAAVAYKHGISAHAMSDILSVLRHPAFDVSALPETGPTISKQATKLATLAGSASVEVRDNHTIDGPRGGGGVRTVCAVALTSPIPTQHRLTSSRSASCRSSLAPEAR